MVLWRRRVLACNLYPWDEDTRRASVLLVLGTSAFSSRRGPKASPGMEKTLEVLAARTRLDELPLTGTRFSQSSLPIARFAWSRYTSSWFRVFRRGVELGLLYGGAGGAERAGKRLENVFGDGKMPYSTERGEAHM